MNKIAGYERRAHSTAMENGLEKLKIFGHFFVLKQVVVNKGRGDPLGKNIRFFLIRTV